MEPKEVEALPVCKCGLQARVNELMQFCKAANNAVLIVNRTAVENFDKMAEALGLEGTPFPSVIAEHVKGLMEQVAKLKAAEDANAKAQARVKELEEANINWQKAVKMVDDTNKELCKRNAELGQQLADSKPRGDEEVEKAITEIEHNLKARFGECFGDEFRIIFRAARQRSRVSISKEHADVLEIIRKRQDCSIASLDALDWRCSDFNFIFTLIKSTPKAANSQPAPAPMVKPASGELVDASTEGSAGVRGEGGELCKCGHIKNCHQPNCIILGNLCSCERFQPVIADSPPADLTAAWGVYGKDWAVFATAIGDNHLIRNLEKEPCCRISNGKWRAYVGTFQTVSKVSAFGWLMFPETEARDLLAKCPLPENLI